ncbi:MAG: hypothetical protein ACL7BU_14575 [Candidatus Phlomobacter fragariae]
MNTLIKTLKEKLINVARKHAQENNVKVIIAKFSEYELNIQIIISGEQQFNITLKIKPVDAYYIAITEE